jgi:hypothetical protein
MPPWKRKTTAKAAANAIANAIAKATAIVARSAKAKVTRARNKATADRILRSSIPRSLTPPIVPLIAGPSRTIGSNLVAKLVTARVGKVKKVEVVNRWYNHNPILFVIKGYLDSCKPCIEHSLLVDFNSIIRLR